jgi:hypothetical protein
LTWRCVIQLALLDLARDIYESEIIKLNSQTNDQPPTLGQTQNRQPTNPLEDSHSRLAQPISRDFLNTFCLVATYITAVLVGLTVQNIRASTKLSASTHRRRDSSLYLPQHVTIPNMAGIKKAKATRAQLTNKKIKPASGNQENEASSTADVGVASPAASPTPSRFFTLPPELRNDIYRYVLVRDELIKVQFDSGKRGRRGRRCYFTMLPALATVSKQVRLETQLIFFEENQFEIAPELLKHRTLAPLTVFDNMHHQLGLTVSTLRVGREVKKRCNGDLFLVMGYFTVSKIGSKLSISNEDYSATYIGRSTRAQATRFRICGCRIRNIAKWEYPEEDGIVQFLRILGRFYDLSCNATDMSRPNEIVHQGNLCYYCNRQGVNSIQY